MAFIQKIDGRNSTYYRVHYSDPVTGKRRSKNFPRYKDAIAFKDQPKRAERGKAGGSATVGEALEHWLRVCTTIGRNGREPIARATARKYKEHVTVLRRTVIRLDNQELCLGDILLSRLTREHCQALKQALTERFSWLNAKKHFTSFKSALSQAREDDLFNHDPAGSVFIRAPAREPDAGLESSAKVPQLGEIKVLLRTLRARVRVKQRRLRRERRRYKLILETIAFGGTRPGEALGLSWSNVLFDRGGIRIMQDVEEDGTIGKPKSRSAYRFVSMPGYYMRQLRWWRKLCPPSELDLVFPNWSGNVEFLANLNARGWQPLLEEAGLVDESGRHKYPPKCLRHARASLEIDKGANPKEIQTMMGHSSIRVTYDIYGHLFEGHHDRRQDRANQIANELIFEEIA